MNEKLRIDPSILAKYGIQSPKSATTHPAPMVEGRGLCPHCNEPIMIVAAITALNIQVGVRKDILAALKKMK